MNPNVDFYFSKAKKWQKARPTERSFGRELEQLRMIVPDLKLSHLVRQKN